MTVPRVCSVEACERPLLARTFCKSHYRRFMTYGDPLHVVARDMKPAPEGHRVCNTCGEAKPLEEFAVGIRSVGGRLRRCTKCTNTYVRTWAKTAYSVPEAQARRRRAQVKSRLGKEALALHDRIQDGAVCDACGRRLPRMAVDHDHVTGRARGVLCLPCNTALGLLAEDPDRFAALLAYLMTHREVETHA